MAANVVRDTGSSVRGLGKFAKKSTKNAERNLHRVISKQMKLSLPIPITKLGRGELAHGILRLRDWMQFLVDKNCFHIIAGLVKPDPDREQSILKAFWAKYRQTNADHPVFSMPLDLSRTAPLLYHGDEGRGRRRTPFLVTSFHSLLGRGVRAGLQAQAKTGVKKTYLKLRPNFIGHSYTSRFLQAAMPKKVFQNEDVFQAVLRQCATEAEFLQTVGVKHKYTGQRYFAVVLNVCGDWAWLYKAGNLTRSYNHLVKTTRDVANPAGICHLCRAGTSGISFEDIHLRNPAWLETTFLDSPFDDPSPLCRLLHRPGKLPGLFAYDLWHSWHLGVGKAFVASAAVLLSLQYPGRSKSSRFQQLSADYLAFCSEKKIAPILSKVTSDTMGFESMNVYPMAGWFKGALTTNFCYFLDHKLNSDDCTDEMLKMCGEAIKSINACISGLYEGDVFLAPSTAQLLGEQGMRFLRRYAALARAACEREHALFTLLPKHHVLHHAFLYLLQHNNCEVVNPMCYSAQVDEDYIGKNSRVSRRVHPSTCVQRCLERHLELAYAKYVEAGYLIEG